MRSRQLEILIADKPPQLFPMLRPIVRIGRARDNDIVLVGAGRDVSRWHAIISQEDQGGAVILADLESENGTYLNGWPIGRPVAVQPDDTIKIGTCRLVFREQQDAKPAGG